MESDCLLYTSIEHSLQEEQFAVEKYTKQINVIKDEVIIHNLKRIILDEELHVCLLYTS